MFMHPHNCQRWMGPENLFGQLSIEPLRFEGGVACLLACRWMDWGEQGQVPAFELRCQARNNATWYSQPIYRGTVNVRTPIVKIGATEQHRSWSVLCNGGLTIKQRTPFVRAIYSALKGTDVVTAINRFLKQRPSFTESKTDPATPKRTTVPSGPSSAPRPGQRRRLKE